MTTTLTGNNSFAVRAVLRQKTAEFIAKFGDLAIEPLDAEEISYDAIQAALNSLPFLVDKKLLILRSPSLHKQFTETAPVLLADLPESLELIIVEPKLDKRSSYYKFLRSKTNFQDLTEPDAGNLERWLVERTQSQGGSLSRTDARYLIERCGGNQMLLSNELDKLVLYSPKVNRETIDLLTEPTLQSTVFQLLETAFAGKAEQALALYEEQRALQVDPSQIIALLAWQLHLLVLVKAAAGKSVSEIAQEARVSPYALGKAAQIVRRLPFATIKAMITALAELDERSKYQAIDIDEALQKYILVDIAIALKNKNPNP